MYKKASNYKMFIIYLALAATTLAVFWQVQQFEFTNYDDDDYVTENVYVMQGLTAESIKWAFTTPHGHTSYWHPLTWLSHMLDCQLFALDAGWHHLTNLLLHIANTLLLFIIFKRMTNTIWRSAFIAAAFALHPLHVESVAWIAERKDVLSTLFWMLTVAGYLNHVKHPAPIRYLITLLAFAMGLMTKPMIVTLPFLLLLLDYWPLERFQKDRRVLFKLILEKVPLFILSAISSTVTFVVQQKIGAVSNVDLVPLSVRLNNSLISYVKYIGKMFWPTKLAVFYPLDMHIDGQLILQSVVAFVLLLTISIFVIYLAGKHKYLLTGWLWYLGVLVPVIGLIQAGAQSHADRYTYIPLTGLFIIITWGLPELLDKLRFPKLLTTTLAVAVLLLLSICSQSQLGYWRNSITLFEHTLKATNANNYVAHNNLGIALKKEGKLNEAIAHYQQALRASPDYADAYNNLGVAHQLQGKLEEAIGHFRSAIELEPDYAKAHNNLGIVFAMQGKFTEAMHHLQRAIQIRPDYAEAYSNIGNTLGSQGKFDEAIGYFNKALQLRPNYSEAHFNLGKTLQSQGKFTEALNQYRRALITKPDKVALLNSTAWILATHPDPKIRNAPQAIGYAEQAARLTKYQNPIVLTTLAAAYAAEGKIDQAVTTSQAALKLAEKAKDKKLAEQIQKQLKLYQRKKNDSKAANYKGPNSK
jgi:tetratricopeptide (TPR) repeat protein